MANDSSGEATIPRSTMTTNVLQLAANQQAELTALDLILLFALKTVALLLGFLTIRMGAKLISQGAKGEFKFSGKFLGMSTNLASVSPGLLFVLLGIVLMGYAVGVNKVVEDDVKQTSPLNSLQNIGKPPALKPQNDLLLPSNFDMPSIFTNTSAN
jgi:hypothetical protein